MKKRKYLIFGILTVITGIALILVSANKTSMIQSIGYRATRRWTTTLICLTIAPAIAFLASTIYDTINGLLAKRREAVQTAQLEAYKEEAKLAERKAQATLNASGQLNDTIIYVQLKEWLDKSWGNMQNDIPNGIRTLLTQMDAMNKYQAKLDALLTSNGADFMQDTRDTLDKAEQDILRKIRKVLNCFVVYDSTDSADVQAVSKLVKETTDTNQTLLDNVKDFLFAVTKALNKQGDDTNASQELEIYKTAILNAAVEND